jgi:hypothetical protein
MSLTHIVMFEVRADADPAAVGRLVTEARAKLTQIPGVSDLRAGWVMQRESPWRVVLTMRLPGEAGLAAYRVHPLHLDYVENAIKPVEKSRSVIDVLDDLPA